MNKGPNSTIRLVRRQNHAGTTVSWTTVQQEKSSHAYKLSSNVQTACSRDSLNNCPKHSILRFLSFALKIYLWLKMCQHNLPCSIVYAHCLLPRRAFASLYVLLFLEKEAEIGGCVFLSLLVDPPMQCLPWHACTSLSISLSLALSLYLQTRFGSRSDPNGIQDRMFRQFKNCACDRKYTKCLYCWMSDFAVQKPMRTISLDFGSSSEAVVTRLMDPNIVFRYFKKPSQNKRFVCKHRAVSLSLSLSLSLHFYDLLSKFANEDRPTCLIRGKQAYQEL